MGWHSELGTSWHRTILYLWGILIGGRRMGISVLLLACVALIDIYFRVLSSYPAASLCFVTGAFGTMWGMKSHIAAHIHCRMWTDATACHTWTCMGPSLVVWMLLSIALRGSLWNKLLRLCVLTMPIYYSHEVAYQYYVFDAIGLESNGHSSISLSLAEDLSSTLPQLNHVGRRHQ